MNYSVQLGELQMPAIAILYAGGLAGKQFLRHNRQRENSSDKRPGHRPHVLALTQRAFQRCGIDPRLR